MKLWQKIALLTAVTLLLSMTIYGAIMVYETSVYNLNQTRSTVQRQSKATAYALAQNLADEEADELSETARRAYLQFLLRRYSNRDCILLQDWEIVVNTTDYELTGYQLEKFDSEEPVSIMQRKDGQQLLIIGQQIPVSGNIEKTWQLLMIRDISGLYETIWSQIGTFLIVFGVIVAFAVNLIFWIVKRMLKPLRDLQEAAGAISQGELKRRVRVRSDDEVGALSRSFNQMAEQIENQVAELEEVSERRKQLLGSLAHELKTPMTSIIGYSDTLLHVKINEEQQKKALSHINNECRRLERLSGKMMNLMELYNNDSIHMEYYPVKQLLNQVVEIEKYHLQEKGIYLAVECAMDQLFIDVDLMESLLVNLVDNAMKASKEGDTIVILAEGTRILVKDCGKGIPADEIPKITEAFYMVDKSRSKKNGGIGLGLALCSQIAKLHGAVLEIKSELGVGTEISVVFSENFCRKGADA